MESAFAGSGPRGNPHGAGADTHDAQSNLVTCGGLGGYDVFFFLLRGASCGGGGELLRRCGGSPSRSPCGVVKLRNDSFSWVRASRAFSSFLFMMAGSA